ncbi:hypothetical protein [Candidatus Cyanaurora vandensis]|uniref:hypothetical protein n=1 Tax=Candidatus Cyanaurora vandensis TaxID=2714958 RepID=UPI0025802B34|nr:hypothetical protein [Candidatus Cyanaurora vandensis]
MGLMVDFAKTKALLMEITLDPDLDPQVNLGVGDDDNEFLLLLQGKRMVACQMADDELLEVFTLYTQAHKWVDLDAVAGPVAYETLELASTTGAGVALLCAESGVVGLQLIVHEGATVLEVEEALLPAFQQVCTWFLLNVVRRVN